MSRLTAAPRPKLVEELVEPNTFTPPVLRVPAWRWFLPAFLRSLLVSVVLTVAMVSLAVGNSMALLGAPRATTLGSGRGTAARMHVGSFTKTIVTGNQDITLPASCPDLTAAVAGTWAIMFSTTHGSTSGTWTSEVWAAIGFTAGAANSYSIGVQMDDGTATANTDRRVGTGCISVPARTGSGLQYEAAFVSFPTSTTMRINWTTNNGQASVINFTVFTGLTGAKAVAWTVPTTATTKAVTTTGVDLSTNGLVLHAFSDVGTLDTSAATAILAFGAMNSAGQQWGNGFMSVDAAADADTQRVQLTDACITRPAATPAIAVKGGRSAMANGSFTATFSTVTSDPNYVISLAMAGVSSKLASFNVASTPQTVTSSHGFPPRGVIFSTVSRGTDAAAATGTVWSLGASDLTNSRAAALVDEEAAATMDADSIWNNDAVLHVVHAPATPAARLMTLTATTGSDFTVAFDSITSISTIEILYLVLG